MGARVLHALSVLTLESGNFSLLSTIDTNIWSGHIVRHCSQIHHEVWDEIVQQTQ